MSQNYREICKAFVRRFLFALILISSFSLAGFAQTEEESDETPSISIPEQAMEQVVRRILTWYFKPRSKPKIIYLYDEQRQGLKKSWLPQIKGVEFRLLSETEAAERDDVYFFTKIEKRPKNKFYIGFAFGDPSCDYEGESWNFRISKQKVRLWQSDEGFGAGCSVGDRK
jgi:hypothetical protein